jgi:hypothetical protein
MVDWVWMDWVCSVLNDSEQVSSSGGEDQGSIDPCLIQLALAGYMVCLEESEQPSQKRAI